MIKKQQYLAMDIVEVRNQFEFVVVAVKEVYYDLDA